MKKLLKNKTFLSMIIGVLIAYISLITCFFVKNQTYFTIMFISNIVINFGVIIYNIVKYDLETEKFKSVTQAAYVLLTVVALVLDVVIMSSSWDMNLYDNVMYLSNYSAYNSSSLLIGVKWELPDYSKANIP